MARLPILLSVLAHLQPALASAWTVTKHYVVTGSATSYPLGCSQTTDISNDDTYCTVYTTSATLLVNPTVTIPKEATPIRTSTSTSYYDDIEFVSLQLPTGIIAASDLIDPYSPRTRYTTSSNAKEWISYVVPMTWTAPASCPTPFTVATFRGVDIPSAVTDQITPTSTSTMVYSRGLYATETPYTTIALFLNPEALPTAALPDSMTMYDYTAMVQSCINPETHYTSYDSDSDDDDDYSSSRSSRKRCYSYSYSYSYRSGSCIDLDTIILIIAITIPTIFVLGFIESYFWFTRLMTGKSTLRLGTICWCLMSLWVLCITRSTHGRTQEDQKVLQERWKLIPAKERVKLWFKWGFRHKYPVELLGDFGLSGNNVVVVAEAGMVGVDGQQQQQPPAYPGAPVAEKKAGVVVQESGVVGVPAPPPVAHTTTAVSPVETVTAPSQGIVEGGPQVPGATQGSAPR